MPLASPLSRRLFIGRFAAVAATPAVALPPEPAVLDKPAVPLHRLASIDCNGCLPKRAALPQRTFPSSISGPFRPATTKGRPICSGSSPCPSPNHRRRRRSTTMDPGSTRSASGTGAPIATRSAMSRWRRGITASPDSSGYGSRMPGLAHAGGTCPEMTSRSSGRSEPTQKSELRTHSQSYQYLIKVGLSGGFCCQVPPDPA